MANNYVSLLKLKRWLKQASTDTVDDVRLGEFADVASREIEQHTHQRFYTQTAARVFSARAGRELWLPSWDGHLVSVSALAVDEGDDGTYEKTLTAADYRLWPYNVVNEPYRMIEIRGGSSQLSGWPEGPASVQVTGKFGFSEELEDTGLTVQGGGINASVTTITLSATAAALLAAGDTIMLESEQVEVVTVSTVTLTVRRARNGTTGAAHAASVVVYLRRYPALVEAFADVAAARLLRESGTAFSGTAGADDFETSYRATFARLMAWADAYRVPVVL